jgi:hypothetical protein
MNLWRIANLEVIWQRLRMDLSAYSNNILILLSKEFYFMVKHGKTVEERE